MENTTGLSKLTVYENPAFGCLCILKSTFLTLQNEIGTLLVMSRDKVRKENDELRDLISQLKYHINNLKTYVP